MPEIPFDVLKLNASAGAQHGVIQGRLGVDISARTKVMADACHGISLGIEGQIEGMLDGVAEALLIGAQVKGRAAAEAGAKVTVKLEPNLFDDLGLSIDAGAFARAHVGGSVGLFFTPTHLAAFANDHFNDFTSDLFLIFLEEVYAEAGVWGKAAFSAMVDGYLNVVFDMQEAEPRFRFGFGYNAGLGGGCGWDFYCDAGFRDLRRALMRSSLRISDELQTQIRGSDVPTPPYLGLALDFSVPLVVLTAYDLGRAAHAKRNLLDAEEITDILVNNTVQQFQRFVLDRLLDTAIGRLSAAFADVYEMVTGIDLDSAAQAALRTEFRAIYDILEKGRIGFADVGHMIGHTIGIMDIIDGGNLDRFKRPLTLLWCAATLGLQIKGQLDEVFADLGISNSILGSASTQAGSALLPPALPFVVAEVSATLDRTVVEIDTAAAVDYLIAEGAEDLLTEHAPHFSEIRNRMSATFDLTEGDIVSDMLRLLKGQGTLGQLRSYSAVKGFVKTEILDGMIVGDLLPRLKQEVDDPVVPEYVTDVVEPCIVTVSSFVFDRLDELLVTDVTSPLDIVEREGTIDKLASGCGEVVYTILVRNVLFFEKMVSEAALTTSHQNFADMRVWLADDTHPFFTQAVALASESLPGHPNVAANLEAFRVLMLDIVTALEHLTGPLVLTLDRRNRLHALKHDLLLPGERVSNFRDGQLVEKAVAEMIACNVPNSDVGEITELIRLFYEIGLDSLEIISEQVLPSIGDFFLKVTLADLMTLRSRLLEAIAQAREALVQAAADFDEATDVLRNDILATLTATRQAATGLLASIKAAVASDWQSLTTARLQIIGREKIADQDLNDTQEAGAILASDAAIATAMAAAAAPIGLLLDNIETTLDGFLSDGTDAVESALNLFEDVEDAALTAFTGVVDWAAEAATVVVETILPDQLQSDITAYLQARETEKELTVAQTDQEQAIARANDKKAAKEAALARIDHNPKLDVTVVSPQPEFTFIYPASLEITVALTGFTSEMLIGQAQRVQMRVNGTPIVIAPADLAPDGDGYLFRRVLEQGSLVDGLNLLEVSWIVGADSDQTRRRSVPFVIDAAIFLPKGDFGFAFDYDPPGDDVDHEFVQVAWNGTTTLDLAGATVSDRANHRYALPDVALAPGAHLRIYTGGSPSSDQIDPAAALQVLHMGRRKAVWNNEGDTLFLTKNDNTLLASATYTADETGGAS